MIKELLVISTALLALCNALPSPIDDTKPAKMPVAVPIEAPVPEAEDNDLSPEATAQGYGNYNRGYGGGSGRGWGGGGRSYGGGRGGGGWSGYGGHRGGSHWG